MKRILLFNPPSGLYRRDNRCQNKVEDQTVNVVFPPMELLYNASILENAGCEVRVRDYPAMNADFHHLENDVREFQPDYAIFTATIATLDNDLQAARLIKELCPNAVTAAKGEPLHYMDEEIIKRNPELDAVLRGEVEAYIERFVDGSDWASLPGLTFLRDGEVVRTSSENAVLNLDELPFPARHLTDVTLYRSPESRNQLTTVVTSLGCPFKCIFCSVPAMTGTNVRYRTPESVVAELEHCMSEHGIHEFLFHADTFTLNKNWVIRLCQLIVQKKLDIRWGCNSRVDTLDEERLIWMKRAGCWVIGFGVETGNDEHLKSIKKSATGAQAREAVALCRKLNVRSHAFLTFGYPWDTDETIRELIQFASELDPDFFDFNMVFPLPGTELDKIVGEKNLVIRERLSNGGYAVGAVSTESLSPDQLERWRRKALWTMYLRPHYIIRTLRNAGSPGKALNYLSAAMQRARNLLSLTWRSGSKSETKSNVEPASKAA
ncbi:MAG: radical SAM protein [Candidatus Hinthialibacter antarcticus]|nr:radical SAM protein [Candidatus Hinthialibacter antarcticus]